MLHHFIPSDGCLKCQESTECSCRPMSRQGRKYVDTDIAYYEAEFAGETSSESRTGRATQMVSCLGSQVDTLVEPRQVKSIELPQTVDYPSPISSRLSIDSSQESEPDISYDSSRRCRISTPPERGGFLESIFSLAVPDNRVGQIGWTPPSSRLTELSESEDDPEELDDIRCAMIGFMSWDRSVESNGVAVVLQACATWLSHFTCEPLPVMHLARNDVFRNYVSGEESRRVMNLLARNAFEITRSADYNPVESSSFFMVGAILRQRLAEARTRIGTTRDFDRKNALEAMLHTNEWISTLFKVGTLPSLLDFLQLAAPVFRQVCPHPLDGLVNLPTLFTTMNVNLQTYSTVDVLLGVLTGRPTFFRYTANFTPEAPESLFLRVDAPGIRWTYGIPDRLVIMFAQMNGLLEDFGPHVPKYIIDELEEDIMRMKPTLGPSAEPSLLVGRMVVQQAWFLAALIYLYMGLCGSDSTDSRIVMIRTQFMKLLSSSKPRRNPDSFLFLPLIILGVATDGWEEQNTIRRRMLGVPECARSGRMGNYL